MRRLSPRLIQTCLLLSVALPHAIQAQAEAAKTYQTNCVLCHSANGSGESSTGKALKAKDLRSKEVQTKPDAELNDSITKGKGKMPAFGKKLKPDDITELVAYIRTLSGKK